jgi:hypothetical protein
MRTILVVANETLGGPKLLERAREEAAAGDTRIVLCVPRKNPTHGNVIYIDSAYDAAQVRIDLARSVLREMGIEAIGEVGDPDPYTATMDAIAEHRPDLVIVSTLPAAASGWLRRDFVERIQEAAGVPVEHIVTDMDQDQLAFNVTLVVANRTANSEALLPELKTLAATTGDRERLFIFVIPIEGGDGLAARAARARLDQVIDRARAEGLVAAGMTGDPDPYTATMNAVSFFHIDDIVISTLPETRSGWLRADLIERVRKAANKPVTHIVDRGAGTPATA